MQKTVYRVSDGAVVVVHDAVDAKEYVATGRYSDKPVEPLDVSQVASPPVVAAQTKQKS